MLSASTGQEDPGGRMAPFAKQRADHDTHRRQETPLEEHRSPSESDLAAI